jgi:hypothetical protein
MGEFVVKAAPDVDLYLIWSTVVDSVCVVGTRAEILAHLWADYRMEHPECTPNPGTGPDARMARADRLGSSAHEPAGMYGWNDEAFHVGEAAPRTGGWWELPRASLVAYARALLADDEAAAHALLQPMDVEDDDA